MDECSNGFCKSCFLLIDETGRGALDQWVLKCICQGSTGDRAAGDNLVPFAEEPIFCDRCHKCLVAAQPAQRIEMKRERCHCLYPIPEFEGFAAQTGICMASY